MFKVLLVIAAIWLILSVLGWVLQLATGLVVIGLLLFLVTAVLGWLKRSSGSDG